MQADETPRLTRGLNESHGAYELVLSPAILALIGFWIDRQVGSTPWITIGTAVLGLVGATIKLVVDYKAKMALHAAKLADDRAEMAGARIAIRESRP